MSRWRPGDIHFDLIRPCTTCPFRVDVRPYLRVRRVQLLHREVLDQEKTFTCHETVSKKEQHCAGALRFIERVMGVHGHHLLRIAHTLGLYRPGTVREDVEVYKSRETMVEAYRKAWTS